MQPYCQVWDRIHQKTSWGAVPDKDFARFVFVENPSKSSSFLDLGCGIGANAITLAENGYSTTAVDGCALAIEKLNGRYKTGPLTGVNQDITTLSYPEQTFDYIIDVCTLEIFDVDDHKTMIGLCKRWLKPEGKIFAKMACLPFSQELMKFPVKLTTLGEIKYVFNGCVLDAYQSFESHENGWLQTHWVVSASVMS